MDGIAPTPDTLGYMMLGYAAAGVLFTFLVVYLIAKARSLRAELRMLTAIETEDNAPKA